MVLARALETHEQHNERNVQRRTSEAEVLRRVWREDLELEAFRYDPNKNYQCHGKICIGKMDSVCIHCQAKKFKSESPGMCCSNGKVNLAPLHNPPDPLMSYMSGDTSESKYFLKNIRRYNSCFQMTSFGAKVIQESGCMHTFKVQGQIYHRAGSLLPLPNDSPKFLQIYFLGDEELEADQRCSNIPGTRRDIVLNIQRMLHEHNQLLRTFKSALDKMPTDEYKVVIHADRTPVGEHERRFNAPTINDVAIVMVGQEFERRDIVIQRRGGNLQSISELHPCYDALQYPLIFWEGEDGYHFNIPKVHPITGANTSKKVTAMEFYASRIMIKNDVQNHILNCRQLFHQFIVDMYAKIESERLQYIRFNQQKLRVDDYIHLRDSIANDGKVEDLGQMVILPATFTGGPRHMHEYAQDAMSYVRAYGRPDLFITFTCNPTWNEVKEELFAGQSASERHDLTARVFKQKLNKFLDVITKCHIFGETRCWMYSIEWQKRGLPHSHILIWLKQKIHPDQIDRVISAEIPNKEEDPLLYEIVTKNMIHGPCGAINRDSPCMKDGKCSKKYPRNFLQETQTGNDGYPLYRRRSPENGGHTAVIKGFQVDNRWVVPYNQLLSKMFQAHINVEYCNSVKSIKYICKYVNKGSDMAVFGIANENALDEIMQYQMGRYISSNEAVWRILNYNIHERYPTVLHLSVHLENGQRVVFSEDNARQRAAEPPQTTLTAFFSLCQQDPFAKTLLYAEVPKYFTWDKSRKVFIRRKRGVPVEGNPQIRGTEALGRVYTVHPTNAECFYLRLLLHVVRGPVSFEELKTVDGYLCETYREACQKRGLLENDEQWESTLSEASLTKSSCRLRDLFAVILTTCAPSNPQTLWNNFKESLSEDILMEARRANDQAQHLEFTSEIFNKGLMLLEDKCTAINGKTLIQLGLQAPIRDGYGVLDADMLRERSYDRNHLEHFVESNKPRLVEDQKVAYDSIIELINAGNGGLIFLDAPGGTGKTFLINLLLADIRRKGEIALALASSGIASTLLDGGRTAHSALKLPLNIHLLENPICNIAKGSGKAKVLTACKVIVWDECTMAHKKALEALDRTMKDLRNNNRIMGGCVVVLAGDFRQILPVVTRGTPADELNACLKFSHLWSHVTKFTLKTNMRVHLLADQNSDKFSKQVLSLGDGEFPADLANNLITFPCDFCHIVPSMDDMIDKVFPNLMSNVSHQQFLCERAIMAPKNDSVTDININIQQRLPGAVTVYTSIDTVTDEQAVSYPTEFLHSLDPPGMPPHKLILKIGSPIILLRNINPPTLCNGTRLCITKLMDNVIEATVITGSAKGQPVFIPRIPMIPTDMPFEFKRLQFPVRLAFAMTINKAQGQSLKLAGINLENPCFSHGQLYVACSRVGSPAGLYILAHEGKTRNIVYRNALQ